MTPATSKSPTNSPRFWRTLSGRMFLFGIVPAGLLLTALVVVTVMRMFAQTRSDSEATLRLMADRVAGLVLDPHPDGEVGGAVLQTESPAHEAALALAELAAGGPDLVCVFLDGLYREAVGVPCPHFLAGGSLRQAGRGVALGGR